MKNYYDVLGIKTEATSAEIKKAYFKMVRKYPPDKFEEEFKEIRAAYELLSDEVTKREYDLMFKLPPHLRQGFEDAKQCIRDDEIEYAIKILEEIRTYEPDIIFIKAALADAYILNGNSGKAIKFYEELINENTHNAAFRGKLADAYLQRGWQKKAISAYEIAIKLDKDNVSLLIGLSDAYIKDGHMVKAIEVLTGATLQTEDVDLKMTIYMKLITYNLYAEEIEEVVKVLEQIFKIASEKEVEEKESIALLLKYVSECFITLGHLKESETWIKRAVELSPNDKEIKELSIIIINSGEAFREFREIEHDGRIESSIINAIGYELFKDIGNDINKEEQKQMSYLVDCGIALEYGPKIKRTIRIIKEEYPNIYSFRKEYFESLGDRKKRKDMISYLEKNKDMISKKFNFFDDMYFDDDDEEDFYFNEPLQEPIHREEPKIGRNDPCPCGSGKKYKKCCGKT